MALLCSLGVGAARQGSQMFNLCLHDPLQPCNSGLPYTVSIMLLPPLFLHMPFYTVHSLCHLRQWLLCLQKTAKLIRPPEKKRCAGQQICIKIRRLHTWKSV